MFCDVFSLPSGVFVGTFNFIASSRGLFLLYTDILKEHLFSLKNKM